MSDIEDEHADHPDTSQYISVGIILAVFTAIEVAISLIGVPVNVAVPSLIVLTVIKFALVILWFMHLRFDSGWFSRVFMFGLLVSLAVYAATIALMINAGGIDTGA